MKRIAVIPCKAFSRRVPSKNFRMLGDKPLWKYTTDYCEREGLPYVVALSVDRPTLEGVPNDRCLVLPDVLHYGHAAELIISLLTHKYIRGVDDHTIVYMMLPTSPFRMPYMVSRAEELLEKDDCRSVVAVAPTNKPCSDRLLLPQGQLVAAQNDVPWLHGKIHHPDQYRVTGTLFAARKRDLLQEGTFHIADGTYGLPVKPWEAIEIDTPEDWQFAELVRDGLLAQQKGRG